MSCVYCIPIHKFTVKLLIQRRIDFYLMIDVVIFFINLFRNKKLSNTILVSNEI